MRTVATGFALQVDLDGPRSGAELRHERAADGSFHLSMPGVSWVTRPWPRTREAVAEQQPLVTAELVLTYDGRVDHRREVAYALGRPTLATASDGAILLAAHERWGKALSAFVLGEYAYAVVDRRDGTVVAGQDSIGLRRICLFADGKTLVVASGLAMMFQAFPGSRCGVDREALPHYFAGRTKMWSTRTLWRKVRELGRGRALTVHRNAVDEHQVWRPDPGRRLRFRDDEECDAAFREHLFEAVEGALRAPGPLFCDVSGGLDSSTVASTAALLMGEQSKERLVALSFRNRHSDETEFQEAVVAKYGLDRLVLDLGEVRGFDDFDLDDEHPTLRFLQYGRAASVLRAYAEQRGIVGSVTGHGGDQLLFKDLPPMYLSEWIRAGRVRDWAREVLAHTRNSTRYSAWGLLGECTVGAVDMSAGAPRRPLPDWLLPSFRDRVNEIQRHLGDEAGRVFDSDARELHYRVILHQAPTGASGAPLADERQPLCSRPLVEFMLALDWEHIGRPDESRVILRRAMRGILPEVIRTRRSKGDFGAPLVAGFKGAWPRIRHLLTGEHLASFGVVEPVAFRAALDRLRAGYAGRQTFMTVSALCLEIWMSLKAGAELRTESWQRIPA